MILDVGIGEKRKETRFDLKNLLLYIPTSERWFSDVGKSNNRFSNVNVGI